MNLPKFKNTFLEEIVSALRKRSKALKHKTSRISIDRIYEVNDDERCEKLELNIDPILPKKCNCEVFIWEDRWIWLDVRKGSKTGWIWEWGIEGRVLDVSGRDILLRIEEMLSKLKRLDADKKEQNESILNNVWSGIIATELKEIK